MLWTFQDGREIESLSMSRRAPNVEPDARVEAKEV